MSLSLLLEHLCSFCHFHQTLFKFLPPWLTAAAAAAAARLIFCSVSTDTACSSATCNMFNIKLKFCPCHTMWCCKWIVVKFTQCDMKYECSSPSILINVNLPRTFSNLMIFALNCNCTTEIVVQWRCRMRIQGHKCWSLHLICNFDSWA